MNDVRLDTTPLEACATGLDAAAERLTNAVGALEKAVGGLGSPWGTGPVGSVIGELYQAVHDLALGCYENHAEVLGDYVSALDGSVEIVEEARRTMESDVKKLAAAIDELYSGPRPPL